MAKILNEPKVLTDFNNDAVCILPVGFELTDEKWNKIWELHEKLNRFMGHEELLELFPHDQALLNKKINPGEK